MLTVIACAHGTADPEGQAQIHALRRRLAEELSDCRVLEASVDVQEPALDDVIGSLPPGPCVILPLLLSTGFHTRVDLRKAAAQREGTIIAGPLGPDPRLAAALAVRLDEAGLERADVVVLAAAGSSVAQGAEDVHAVAAELRRLIPNPVIVGFGAAAEPSVPEAVAQARLLARGRPGGRVVAASYILATGHFQRVVERAGADVTAQPLLAGGGEPAELVAQCATARLAETRP